MSALDPRQVSRSMRSPFASPLLTLPAVSLPKGGAHQLPGVCPSCGSVGGVISSNPARAYLSKVAVTNREDTRNKLNWIARVVLNDEEADGVEFPWSDMRYQHLLHLRGLLLERVDAKEIRAGSANAYLRIARGVLKEAWAAGDIGSRDHEALRRVPDIQASEQSQAPMVSPEEIARLLDCLAQDDFGNPVHRARDRCIVATLYGTGVRRAELVNLTTGDLDLPNRVLRVVHGKGRKDRWVPIPEWLVAFYAEWLSYRGMDDGALFPLLTKGGNIRDGYQAMTKSTLATILTRRCDQAGIRLHSPHAFRRAYATFLRLAHVAQEDIQELMGHARGETTKRYFRNNQALMRASAARLPSPAQLRTFRVPDDEALPEDLEALVE